VLLVQGRGEMSFLPAITAVLLHHIAMNTWTGFSVVLQGRGEMAVQPVVTAVLLHHSAMNTWTDRSVPSTG